MSKVVMRNFKRKLRMKLLVAKQHAVCCNGRIIVLSCVGLSVVILLFVTFQSQTIDFEQPWTWECVHKSCVKKPRSLYSIRSAVPLSSCRILCDINHNLWPILNGFGKLGNGLITIDPGNITIINNHSSDQHRVLNDLLDAGVERFKKQLLSKIYDKATLKVEDHYIEILFEIVDPKKTVLSLRTNENYGLEISDRFLPQKIVVIICADNYFGIRNALETLNQLIIFDDFTNELKIINRAYIEDGPVYSYRGVLLDTSKTYYSIKSIQKTIDAMGTSKLNSFHWILGNVNNMKIYVFDRYCPSYTADDVNEIVNYALVRGVRVIPEFNINQLSELSHGLTNKTYDFASFLNISNLGLISYDATDFGSKSEDTEYNSKVNEISTESRKSGKQSNYHKKQLQMLQNATSAHVPIIVRTSEVVDMKFVTKFLSNTKHIIQLSTSSKDKTTRDILLKKGYQLILSNCDKHNLDMDCMVPKTWNKCCEGYNSWKKIYGITFGVSAMVWKRQIMGAEAVLYSFGTDEHSLDAKLWPRVSALSERLWADPMYPWQNALSRMNAHRERLVEQGINAEALQPMWCLQNENSCT